ncbi:MAG: lamin tail domain-containing protein [Acidobacteriota bacterium]|nr:lamin tail domain-containing protein [Acidobacteriota bacterium]
MYSLIRSTSMFAMVLFAGFFLLASQSTFAQVTADQLLISEFRLHGPNGASDEFIELYNNTDSDITVATTDLSAGWALVASDGATRFTITNGTMIPARGHYLGVNSVGYSLTAYPAGNGTTAIGDTTYTTDIPDNAGIALFNTSNPANFTLANRLDAVGSISEANTLYKEGTGYPDLNPFLNVDFSLYRSLSTGLPKDTNNNEVDFVLVDTSATQMCTSTNFQCARLGAPGPENRSSPIQRNALIPASLIAPCVAASQSPNRVRDTTPGPPLTSSQGTLDTRRRFTNNTGVLVTRLRFRIVTITSYPPPPAVADLRAITSTALAPFANPCGAIPPTITVQGTTLEEPPSQPNGGAYNSTLSAGTITLTPLAPGASIDLRFLLGVQQPGSFRFFVNVEALP